MRYAGQTIKVESEIIVIPKGNKNYVFKAYPILDYDDFNKLFPRPEPPTITEPGKPSRQNTEDKNYNIEMDEWAGKRIDWMLLTSLKATEELEWDTVDLSDPKTWGNYRDELAEVFTPAEISAIIDMVTTAC